MAWPSDSGNAMRHDDDFQVWVNRVQLVTDRIGFVDGWVYPLVGV
jgi:hypothetical protein